VFCPRPKSPIVRVQAQTLGVCQQLSGSPGVNGTVRPPQLERVSHFAVHPSTPEGEKKNKTEEKKKKKEEENDLRKILRFRCPSITNLLAKRGIGKRKKKKINKKKKKKKKKKKQRTRKKKRV